MEIYFFHKDVKIFIQKLEESTRAKVGRVIDLLEGFGQNLGMPHSRALAFGVFELRIRGTQDVRILYVFHEGAAIFLKGFVKKSNQTPRNELEVAMRRKKLLDKI